MPAHGNATTFYKHKAVNEAEGVEARLEFGLAFVLTVFDAVAVIAILVIA